MEPTKQPDLSEVRQLFTIWRTTRSYRSRIPAELWEAAASLAGQYSIHQISRELGLNHTALRDQVASRTGGNTITTAPQACFLEIPPLQPFALPGCLVEMENQHGEKMRMHFSGEVGLDLVAVSQHFWGRS